MKTILIDNGSLEPAPVYALRALAQALSERLGHAVLPASLAHSDKIDPRELGGRPARLVEDCLRGALVAGEREFLIVPFFIGPSRAVTQSLPRLVERLRAEFYAGAFGTGELRVQITPTLHQRGDSTLARALADECRALWARTRELASAGGVEVEGSPKDVPAGVPARVALVDHGSPAREVIAVRDEVAAQLEALLGEANGLAQAGARASVEVVACSMERRPGPDYAFNEPLLADVLSNWGRSSQAAASEPGPTVPIIIAQLFLLPGRHAGPGGDIAQLCVRAQAQFPQLRPLQTAPLIAHPLLVDLALQRINTALGGF